MQNNLIKQYYSGQINAANAQAFLKELTSKIEGNPDADVIEIDLSSGGGDIDIAIELYFFLRSLDCKVRIVNTSYVNSAAIILFLSGDERVCHGGSTFYIHSLSKKLRGVYSIQDLELILRELKSNSRIVAKLYEERTFKTSGYWLSLMTKGIFLDAKKALRLGLCTSHVF